MREKDILHVLNYSNCKEVTREDIIQFLIDEGYLTFAGSDFENEIIQESLDNLDWSHICDCMKEWNTMASDSETESENEEEED